MACREVRLLKPLILARSNKLYAAAVAPRDPCTDEEVKELVCKLLAGQKPAEPIPATMAIKALAIFYGGLTLFYTSRGWPTLLSRLLPEHRVQVEDASPCEPPKYSVEELLDEWSLIASGDSRALERLGRCSVDPPGLRLVTGKGDPLPPTGVVYGHGQAYNT